VWLKGTLKTPPVGREARVEAGTLLLRVQWGESLGMPHSRPMPKIGKRVHELRVRDGEKGLTWRIIYRVDADAIVVPHWWAKKTEKTSERELTLAQDRLRRYDETVAQSQRKES